MSNLVIYDVDDVLLNTNSCLCECLGIDINTLDCWNLYNHPQREQIMMKYHDKFIYESASLCDGAEQVLSIAENLMIHTGCANKDTAQAKLDRLVQLGFKENQVILDFSKEKQMLDCFIQVEDSFENLSRSTAEHKILINKPWNQKELEPRMVRVNSLLEANDKVREFLNLD